MGTYYIHYFGPSSELSCIGLYNLNARSLISVRLFFGSAAGMSEGGRRHPVLVFIHGESYDWGSGNTYDGSVLAAYSDQVVITINYRLGVLGFLNANVSPHTKARVANYGLMDQIAALHWIQQNVEYFGGDPSNVTLMGQGTGAACVNFLAISPTVMSGLFKRAILLSGSALSSWAVVDEPASYALKLARAVNCSVPVDLIKDHELLVDCLRESSLEALMRADLKPPTFLSAFGPSVDGVVIKPDFKKDLLSYLGPEFQGYGYASKRAEHGETITSNNKYDLLFGVTTNEALWKFAERDVQKGFEGERRDRIIRTYVRNAYMYHLTEIFYTIVNEYTDWDRTVQHPVNTRDACIQALSDAQFVAPLVQTGDLFTLRHTGKSAGHGGSSHDDKNQPKTYFYVFDYQMKEGDYPQKMGSVHGEELPFVFGAPLVDGFGHFPRNYTKAEMALSESIIQYFANFVRTGNPNGASDGQHQHGGKGDSSIKEILPASKERNRYRTLTWDQYDPVHQKYLEIGMKPKMKNHYRAHQLSVWLRLVPELHRAGMEDVEPRHNLFRGHADPSLYDGFVRPDPLSRVGSNDIEKTRRGLDLTSMTRGGSSNNGNGGGGNAKNNATTESSLSPTTQDYSMTTCVSLIQNSNAIPNIHNASTDTLASLDAAGYAAYSTALSVTIAIGCSLLILNVLIFAGVYYQRDKTRLEVKSLQQQQMMNQQCGPRGFNELKQLQPPPPGGHGHYPGGGQVIVDVENEMLRRNAMKNVTVGETNMLLQQHQQQQHQQQQQQQTQLTHTLPHPHHYQKQHQSHHSTLPRGGSVILPDISTQQSQGPPNGSIHLTVPRPPPPPRAKSPPENQPLLMHSTIPENMMATTQVSDVHHSQQCSQGIGDIRV
uniref:Carboxylesterase type B domain-containing protein n=1 Tax=Trichogramma kaykai TaxID=54128 RepID=A0ABD2XGP8_9HYME